MEKSNDKKFTPFTLTSSLIFELLKIATENDSIKVFEYIFDNLKRKK